MSNSCQNSSIVNICAVICFNFNVIKLENIYEMTDDRVYDNETGCSDEFTDKLSHPLFCSSSRFDAFHSEP